MPVNMAGQPLNWMAMLVFTAIAMIGQPVPYGSGTHALFERIQVTNGTCHELVRPSAAAGDLLCPDRGTAVERDTEHLWAQLGNGFALPADRPAAVQAQLERFARNPDNIERILQRGKPWLQHIISEIDHRGLPMELALLPVIESAFDPFARSPRDAAGLWQFMPATARDLGLQQDGWYDGRRDVIAATAAALDYLTQLRQRFDGDWLLALAAYNAGAARVQRAIRHNRATGKPADFWHLQLPGETRDYVPKLLALRALIETPQDYGLDLPAIPDALQFAVIDTGGQLDLGVAARLAGISLDEIHRLNPAFIRQTIHRNGPHTLVLPKASAATFSAQLARLPEEQRVQWVRHRIRSGDTLSDIAQQYRITVTRLREFNRLTGSRIIAGDLLIVPDARG
jgi:membrane-bound lytic murein transglycosylase D